MRPKVTIIDYGVGNLLSVSRALQESGADVHLSDSASSLATAERVILPGVGAFGQCIDRLRAGGFEGPLMDFVDKGRPLMGICVGMQMLMSTGEEFGRHLGLNIIPGTVSLMSHDEAGGHPVKVPHIGWFQLQKPKDIPPDGWRDTPLADTEEGSAVYFLHSYEALPRDSASVMAGYEINQRRICAAVRKDNVFGTQFHPEKSGRAGLQIMKTFLSL